MPKVSFVIRTKNEEVWLERVLKAVFNQSFQDFDIIIVDSGSTDSTLEIISRFPTIKLIQIKPEDFGYSYALNLGIRASNSEYIAIISAHSLPDSKSFLQSGVSVLDSNSKVVAVTGHYYDLPDAPFNKRIEGWFNRRFKNKREHGWKYLTNTNSLIRRNLWESYNFDETLPEYEDYDWALEMLHRDYDVVLEPGFWVLHSHYHVKGGKSYEERQIEWGKIIATIDKKKR
jgi:glycosyltransferase involved in cell wall biosynthesis